MSLAYFSSWSFDPIQRRDGFQNKRCFKSTATPGRMHHSYISRQLPNKQEVFTTFVQVSLICFMSICDNPETAKAFWDFSVSAYPPEELKELFGGTARLVVSFWQNLAGC